MDSPNLIVGVFGLGAIQLASLYEATAPSLKEMRGSDPDSIIAKQQLLDANIIVGSFTLVLAGLAYYATKQVTPPLLFIGAVGGAMVWRYMVLYAERF